MTFYLDGTPLVADYDDVEDILYLWVTGPVPSVTFETREGHLVQLAAESREFVGATIIDYRQLWEGKPITLDIPQFEQHVLQPA